MTMTNSVTQGRAAVRRSAMRPVLLTGLLCMGLAIDAVAATAAGTMSVTATVASSCVVGTSSLNFGMLSSVAIQTGTGLDATGTVSVNCTTGSAYTIALDKGAGAAATAAARKMTNPAAVTLDYNLYSDAGRTTIWGDGTVSTTPSASITGTGAPVLTTTYGRIVTGQTVPAAAYTDTVNVTVTY